VRQPVRPRSSGPADAVGFVQAVYADSATGVVASQSATLSTPATAGHLLVACANSDATLTTPSGFTLAASAINAQGGYLWYKIASGGEATVTTTPSVSDVVAMAVVEYGGVVGVSPLDVTVTNTVSSGGPTTGSPGTTAATAQAVELLVAMVGPHSFAAASPPSSPAWSNSFTDRAGGATAFATASQNAALFVADLTTSATGTYTTTATWTNASSDYGAILAAFKMA
jgi:hypothetical protein